MHRSEFYMPAVVAAYSRFMNELDRFNQMQSTSPKLRCEKRVLMSMLDFLLDASIHSTYALMKALRYAFLRL